MRLIGLGLLLWLVWGLVFAAVLTYREIRSGSTYTLADLFGALWGALFTAQLFCLFEVVDILFAALRKIVVFRGRQ
jgi:hypothetical protein